MIRPFASSDAEALVRVYRDAVRTIAPQEYTAEQVSAWALFPDDLDDFRIRMGRGVTLVAEEAGHVVAFGQLEPNDHLDFLYCCGDASRKGIGSAIYRVLEADALAKGVLKIHTEASRISRPFFEKHGYLVAEVEHVIRFGVEFERFRMTKKIQANQTLLPTPTSITDRSDARSAPDAVATDL